MLRIPKFRLKRSIKAALTAAGLLVAIGFVEKKQAAKTCTGVNIRIEDAYDTYFINENDVLALMTSNSTEKLIGAPYKNIDIRKLELRIKSNKFIRECQVYSDLTGALNVEIEQARPLARLIHPTAPDRYISEEGAILPMSERFTARVVLLEGKWIDKLIGQPDWQTSDEGKNFFALLHFIDSDKFWKAQVAQLSVSPSGNIKLFPQVGSQVIEFGDAADFERKFEKLKLFYKQILPVKGWNRYSRVNVAYKNQIICE
jgi:cell division protein FtsQ